MDWRRILASHGITPLEAGRRWAEVSGRPKASCIRMIYRLAAGKADPKWNTISEIMSVLGISADELGGDTMSRCEELCDDRTCPESRPWHNGLWRCNAAATEYRRQAPADRGVIRACYCDAHGGSDRARQEVESSWDILAPASVVDVAAAGAMGLSSEHAILVLRQSPDQKKPWAVSLGIGSHTQNVGQYASEQEAMDAGRTAWSQHLERDLSEIRESRGGTLNWGMPVTPRLEPVILRPQAGESAWDCYERQGSR
jgi:hypothetical protein